MSIIEVGSFGHKETAPVKQGIWGNHKNKPQSQVKWENAVTKELDRLIKENVQEYFPYMSHIPEIAEVDEGNEDCRPRLFDPQSKQWMLVDSCAQVSVWPRHEYQDAVLSNKLALQAVNGTKIPTYGTRERERSNWEGKVTQKHSY